MGKNELGTCSHNQSHIFTITRRKNVKSSKIFKTSEQGKIGKKMTVTKSFRVRRKPWNFSLPKKRFKTSSSLDCLTKTLFTCSYFCPCDTEGGCTDSPLPLPWYLMSPQQPQELEILVSTKGILECVKNVKLIEYIFVCNHGNCSMIRCFS